MNNFTSSSKFIWMFAIIGMLAIVIAVLVALWVNHRIERAVQDQDSTKQASEFAPKITPVASDKLPAKFPADIPMEPSAKVTQNYNATTPDGRFQATRAFITNKSLAENLKLYEDYFRKSGWTIQSTVNLDNYKAVTATQNVKDAPGSEAATKGKVQLQVAIDENSTSKVKTISISFTELPE